MAIRVDYRASLSLVGSVLKYLSVPLAIPLAVGTRRFRRSDLG